MEGPLVLLPPLAGLVFLQLQFRTKLLSDCNYGYDQSIVTVKQAPVPVVSVGNLTLGGTGKTPLVAWLAQWFAQQNKKPAIISRGYKAKSGQLSDEAAELKILLPAVPHFANKQRIIAAKDAAARGSDVLLLDDGFQHRQLGRDLNLVAIDATDPFLQSSFSSRTSTRTA